MEWVEWVKVLGSLNKTTCRLLKLIVIRVSKLQRRYNLTWRPRLRDSLAKWSWGLSFALRVKKTSLSFQITKKITLSRSRRRLRTRKKAKKWRSRSWNQWKSHRLLRLQILIQSQSSTRIGTWLSYRWCTSFCRGSIRAKRSTASPSLTSSSPASIYSPLSIAYLSFSLIWLCNFIYIHYCVFQFL